MPATAARRASRSAKARPSTSSRSTRRATAGIDAVRDLRERLPYPPGQLKRKVYILDEAHQITRDAWNALLKSLEEPPDFVIFMFASTEPSGFPPAILSRLQRFDVRRLTVAEIEGKLSRILAADDRAADPAAIRLIARLAAGGMRDAESMLDQLLSAAPERIEESTVRDLLGLADAEVVVAFVDHLVNGDGAAGVALLDSLEERGRDIRALLDQAVEAIRGELIAGLDDVGPRRHDVAALAAAGRRLAAIDPNRAGIGGLRFQLELAMFTAERDRPADGPLDAMPRPTRRRPRSPQPSRRTRHADEVGPETGAGAEGARRAIDPTGPSGTAAARRCSCCRQRAPGPGAGPGTPAAGPGPGRAGACHTVQAWPPARPRRPAAGPAAVRTSSSSWPPGRPSSRSSVRTRRRSRSSWPAGRWRWTAPSSHSASRRSRRS